MNPQTNRNKKPTHYMALTLISLVVFDIFSSLLAYSVSFDVDLFLSVLLAASLLGLLCFLIGSALIRMRHRDTKSAIYIGTSAVICLFLAISPHLARYQGEMARFLINGGYYLGQSETNNSAIKIYHWHDAGGLSEPTFVDLVFDPDGQGEWTLEVHNLARARSKEVPSYLLNQRCNHEMDDLFDHFYVITTTCQASDLNRK